MAKLKLKNLSNIGDVLTSEELKHIYGGDGSGSGVGSEPISCFCVYTEANDPMHPEPYETSVPLSAYTNTDCKNMCEKVCRDVVGHSACEAVCGYSMC